MVGKFIRGVVFVLLGVFSLGAFADIPADKQTEIDAALKASVAAQKVGPVAVPLLDQAVLNVPAGYAFVPMPEAGRFMRSLGNPVDNRLVGLVWPVKKSDWAIIVEYEKSGYVKDDDAKDWNVDDLYKTLKEGTEASNKSRREQGFPEIEVKGWVERPNYDAVKHRLVWAMAAAHKGAQPGDEESVNYNTYALGREGYFSLNLISGRSVIGERKTYAQTMLSSLEFNQGKRYEDFNSSTDKVAEYGLAALVAGVAAKKLGFLAVALAFLAKSAKVIGVAAVAAIAGIKKFFGGKRGGKDPVPDQSQDQDNA